MGNPVRTNAGQTMTVRQQILSVAKQLADEGAHYLWGGNGEIPNSQNIHLFAPPILTNDINQEIAFCAARKSVEGQPFVCSGRCLAVNNGRDPTVPNPGSDQRFIAFLAKYVDASGKIAPQTNWGTELTPRKVLGSGAGEPMQYTGTGPVSYAGKIVFGEGCDDTKHFDCYGFVNWVVERVCGVKITRGTSIPLLRNPAGDAIGTVLGPDEPTLPADIWVFPGHIAFAIGSPVKDDSNGKLKYHIAQAEASLYGVNYGKARTDAPTHRIRLSDSTLLNKH